MPGLALLLARRSERSLWPSLARVVAGGAPFALAYLGYDLLRWGTLADAGYGRLAEGDVFFDHGVFSLLYLPRHLQAIFLESPELVPGTWLFLKPHYLGMSLFLTTPAFLWLFAGLRRLRRDATVAALALAAGLALVPDVTHATVGFAQFGYRFSLDAQPMLVTLALAGDALSATGWRRWPSPLFVLATVLAVAVNVYALAVVLHLGYINDRPRPRALARGGARRSTSSDRPRRGARARARRPARGAPRARVHDGRDDVHGVGGTARHGRTGGVLRARCFADYPPGFLYLLWGSDRSSTARRSGSR